MKVFVIKGSIKGMVKIDNKIHLIGDNFDTVEKVILSFQNDIKVINRAQLNENISFAPVDVLLLDGNDTVIGYGSEQGKPNINAILIKYKKTIISTNNSLKNNEKSRVINTAKDKMEEKQNTEIDLIDLIVKNVDNMPKIDPKIENLDISQTNDCDLTNEKIDIPNDMADTQVNDFVESILDTTNKQINCNDSSVCPSNNVEHIILGKDDNIESGVDFIMQNLGDEKGHTNNYYNEIKNDLEKFLNSHKRNEELESKVWGSRWVKINADYNYSVGVIFEDNMPSIIAYAIPYSDFNQIDMDNLKFGEWLKISDKPNENRGYFVYYQNAQTGEMILNCNN